MPINGPPRRGKTAHAGNAALAGTAGGGIGTIIASMVKDMPDSGWKHVLTVSTPLITIVISGVVLFIKVAYIDPFVNRRKLAAANEAKAHIDAIVDDQRKLAAKVKDDSSASAKHKREIQRQLEVYEELQGQKNRERIAIFSMD
jgi:hypothetical protein